MKMLHGLTGKQLAKLRKTAGLSQIELAGLAGTGRHAVSYWECKDQIDLRAWAVRRFLAALGLPDYFRSKRARASWGFISLDRRSSAPISSRTVSAVTASTHRVACGAKTRTGAPCRMKSVRGRKRCKFHSGLSTGPKTQEGRERIADAQRRRWRETLNATELQDR